MSDPTYVFATAVIRYVAACNSCDWSEEFATETEGRIAASGHAGDHGAQGAVKRELIPESQAWAEADGWYDE